MAEQQSLTRTAVVVARLLERKLAQARRKRVELARLEGDARDLKRELARYLDAGELPMPEGDGGGKQ